MEDILYRTNSFTGNQNPFHDVVDILLTAEDQLTVLHTLSDYFEQDPENPDYIGTRIYDMLGGFTAEEYFQEFMARSESYREEFYQIALSDIKKNTGVDIKIGCWFSTKNIILQRKNGYGKNLCKENGILRCYDKGIVLFKKGFDSFCAYTEEPKLSPDTVTNNQLISLQQLNKLLNLEDAYGKILADTCLKRDVLNLLKRADRGLLGNSFTPSFEARERRTAEERERIISDIL